MIRIVTHGPTAHSAKITTEDGTPISGVAECTIRMTVDSITTAEMSLHVDALDITAHPLISRETLERAAEAYGLALVPLAEGVQPDRTELHARLQRNGFEKTLAILQRAMKAGTQ